MSLLKSKLSLGIICFLLGLGSMFVAQKFLLKSATAVPSPVANIPAMDPLFDQFFNEEFFGHSRDPFEEMRRMREGLQRQFNKDEGAGIFDSWFKKKFGGGSAGDITRREDKNFLYYDISVEGLKKEDLTVKVEDGQLSISGNVERKTEGESNSSSYYKSSFHRSFPVPPNVDAGRVEMEQKDGMLVVKFPKLQSENS